MYGKLVDTKFIDVNESIDTEVNEMLEKGMAPLPIVKMNGEVRITGHLFVPLLISEIDSILEGEATS